MDIYVNVEDGTWGNVSDVVVITDAPAELISSLDDSSPTEVIEAGIDWGDPLNYLLAEG